MAIDPGTGKTCSISASEKVLQVCPCGLKRKTSIKGLRIHQGKKGCLKKGQKAPRTDNYFLRSQSNKSNEVQQPESHQSLQDIRPLEECDSSSVTEIEGCTEPIQPKPLLERKMRGEKLQVKWPGASEKKHWETVNMDLASLLQRLKGTAERQHR